MTYYLIEFTKLIYNLLELFVLTLFTILFRTTLIMTPLLLVVAVISPYTAFLAVNTALEAITSGSSFIAVQILTLAAQIRSALLSLKGF